MSDLDGRFCNSSWMARVIAVESEVFISVGSFLICG
jgi:hypothetical protein